MYRTQEGKRVGHITECLKESRYAQKGCLEESLCNHNCFLCFSQFKTDPVFGWYGSFNICFLLVGVA
jgi:hypothetical protein